MWEFSYRDRARDFFYRYIYPSIPDQRGQKKRWRFLVAIYEGFIAVLYLFGGFEIKMKSSDSLPFGRRNWLATTEFGWEVSTSTDGSPWYVLTTIVGKAAPRT
jgi:hypothetical protein